MKKVKFLISSATTHKLTIWQQKQIYRMFEKLFGQPDSCRFLYDDTQVEWNGSLIQLTCHTNGRFSARITLHNHLPTLTFEKLIFGFAKRRIGLWCKHAATATEKEIAKLQKQQVRFQRNHVALIDDK